MHLVTFMHLDVFIIQGHGYTSTIRRRVTIIEVFSLRRVSHYIVRSVIALGILHAVGLEGVQELAITLMCSISIVSTCAFIEELTSSQAHAPWG
jgi:hypothetical protein